MSLSPDTETGPPKKTLFLSEIYPPLLGGTAAKFSGRFASCSTDDVFVVTRTVPGAEEFDRVAAYGISRIPMKPGGIRGFEWLSAALQLAAEGLRVSRKSRFDAVECARPIPEGVAGWMISKLRRIPLVVNVQGEDVSVLRNYRVERWVMRRVLRSARLSIANSRFSESLIKELAGSSARTTVVPPGLRLGHDKWIAPETRVSEFRDQLGKGPILLTAGRLQARKGQDCVIRALPSIRKEFPEVRYVVVGSEQGGTPRLRETLEELAAAVGVAENVLVVGEVSNGDLATYYTICDVFAMPNRSEPGGDVEGFGQVFLEAGYFGKAVIGGRSGGVPDAIKEGETGLLVDGTSPDEVSAAILSLLKDHKLRESLGRCGKEYAQSLDSQTVAASYREKMSSYVFGDC